MELLIRLVVIVGGIYNFSSIYVQLKKGDDLIPNILTIAQKFIEPERGLMEEVTTLRIQIMGILK